LVNSAASSVPAALGDAEGLSARLCLARALLGQGRAAEAFAQADAALALSPNNVVAWTMVAEALAALGEAGFAARACARAVELAPDAADLRVRCGQLLEAADRPLDAAAAYGAALSREPSPQACVAAHVSLSGLFGRAGQFGTARAHATSALALDPEHQGALQNLAAICDHEGLREDAEAHRARAYRGRALIVERSPQPRRRVLTLASAGRANSPDRQLIPAARYERMLWFLGHAEAPPPGDYDVVFNAVADADAARALADRLASFTQSCARTVLNPPERIALTSRDAAASVFAETPGLVVPLARRVSQRSDLSGLPPGEWLLRLAGAHGGEGLERLTLEDAARRLDGRAHYLTRFHDFRSPDGVYRKYRMIFVDRVAFPYHLAIHDDWLIHYDCSLTPGVAAYLDGERRYLENPRAALGEVAYQAVAEIGRRLDLDFAGADFAVLPDGRALLFEANATMLAHDEPRDSPLASKNPYVRRIFEAFWARLESA
jgi:Tfp pilus assembly protein PilF